MNKFKQRIAGLVNGIHKAFVILAMVLLVTMTLVIAVNVFMRYVLNTGLTWAEELSKVMVVWFTFIAMAIGVKQNLHISIHILPHNLSEKFNRVLDLVRDFSILTVALVCLFYGEKLIGITKSSIMPATEWPGSTLYFILPFSAFLIIMEVLMDLFKIDDDAAGLDKEFMGGRTDAES